MLFKEALRTGFFEYQDARDKYRELCASKGMHRDLVKKFIRTQATILCPICPHTAEYIWQALQENGSALNAPWPEVTNVDEILLKSFGYLMDACHSFRLRLKAFAAQSKKDKQRKEALKPTHGVIYVAKKFPKWQSIVISTMKKLYEVSKNVL